RQQKLSRGYFISTQAVLVGPHEEGLPDGCTGLQLTQVCRPATERKPADARADSSRADQRYLTSGGADALKLIGQGLYARRLQSPVRAGEHVCAHFDDDRVGLQQYFLSNGIDHFDGPALAATGRPGRPMFDRALPLCLYFG